MEYIVKDNSHIFFEKDLVNLFGKHHYDPKYGFTNHNGVLILWDEYYDTDIFKIIDDMCDISRECLLVAHIDHSFVNFLWKSFIPHEYEQGESFRIPDSWFSVTVKSSKIVSGIRTYDAKINNERIKRREQIGNKFV